MIRKHFDLRVIYWGFLIDRLLNGRSVGVGLECKSSLFLSIKTEASSTACCDDIIYYLL